MGGRHSDFESVIFLPSHSGQERLKPAQTKKFKLGLIFGNIVTLVAKLIFLLWGPTPDSLPAPPPVAPWEAHSWSVCWQGPCRAAAVSRARSVG